MDTYSWYQKLEKPFFAPPSWLFGPVWTVLYIIIFITFGQIILKVINKQFPVWILIPLGLNLLSNFLFTPLQFGLRSNLLAAIDISVCLLSLFWLVLSLYPLSKSLSLSQIPYLVWVSFATVLQFSITYLNWGK